MSVLTHLVRPKVPAPDWEAAVRAVGELMQNDGAVTSGYVDAMVRSKSEFGPYFVIAPGVAMPHARPEAGVIRPVVALITLDQPVEFGHESNDPVDLIIAFAAQDKHEHLDRLRQIAELVGDEGRIAALRKARTDHDMITAQEGEEGGS